jgi:hypothetical protein
LCRPHLSAGEAIKLRLAERHARLRSLVGALLGLGAVESPDLALLAVLGLLSAAAAAGKSSLNVRMFSCRCERNN